MAGTLHQILWAVIIILGIFGVLYMINFNNMQQMLNGIAILCVCGALIFVDVFISKHQLG